MIWLWAAWLLLPHVSQQQGSLSPIIVRVGLRSSYSCALCPSPTSRCPGQHSAALTPLCSLLSALLPRLCLCQVTHPSIHYLIDWCFVSDKAYFIQPLRLTRVRETSSSFLSHLAMVSQRPVSDHLWLDPLWKIKNSGYL